MRRQSSAHQHLLASCERRTPQLLSPRKTSTNLCWRWPLAGLAAEADSAATTLSSPRAAGLAPNHAELNIVDTGRERVERSHSTPVQS